MTLVYPGIGGKPVIAAAIRCVISNKGYFVNMLLDTGADETCFPAVFAHQFGHNNLHPDVEVCKDAVQGIGGTSDAFIHSVQVSLLDPIKSREKKPVIAWISPMTKAPFIEKLNCLHGLIGMDIISRWQNLSFQPVKKGILIRITI